MGRGQERHPEGKIDAIRTADQGATADWIVGNVAGITGDVIAGSIVVSSSPAQACPLPDPPRLNHFRQSNVVADPLTSADRQTVDWQAAEGIVSPTEPDRDRARSPFRESG